MVRTRASFSAGSFGMLRGVPSPAGLHRPISSAISSGSAIQAPEAFAPTRRPGLFDDHVSSRLALFLQRRPKASSSSQDSTSRMRVSSQKIQRNSWRNAHSSRASTLAGVPVRTRTRWQSTLHPPAWVISGPIHPATRAQAWSSFTPASRTTVVIVASFPLPEAVPSSMLPIAIASSSENLSSERRRPTRSAC